MTLVAALKIDGIPVMLGDLLISNESPSKKKVNIPSVGNALPDFSPEHPYHIHGTKQKLCILGENLAIGWAGLYIVAKTITSQLAEKNKKSPLTLDDIKDYFENLNEWTRHQEVQLMGYLLQEGHVARFRYKCLEFNDKIFGDVTVAGTGSIDFEKTLKKFSIPPVLKSEVPNPLVSAASQALLLSGFLLQSEIANQRSLEQFYGGGYEVLTLINRKFQKIDSITHLFWLVRTDGKKISISFPYKAIKCSYVDDILVMRVTEFQERKQPETSQPAYQNMNAKDEIHIVEPIYRPIRKDEYKQLVSSPLRTRFPLKSRFLCQYMLVSHLEKPQLSTQVLCRVDLGQERHGVLFEETPNGMNIAINNHYMNEMALLVAEKLRNELKN